MIKKIYLLSSMILCAAILSASTISVINTNDTGVGSLREAIIAAVNGDVIAITTGGTITLSSELPTITKTITINGYSTGTTISGNNAHRIFTVQIPTGTVTLNGLNILNGKSTIGAAAGLYAITSTNGSVVLTNCTLAGCNTTGSEAYGGAIASSANISLTNCTLYGNTAELGGGALATISNCTVTILNSTIYNNHSTSATGTGGLDIAENAVVNIQNTILAGNTAGVSASNSDKAIATGGTLVSAGNNLSNTTPFAHASDLTGQDLATKVLLSALALDASGKWVCALQPGSVALNNANSGTAPTLDQCGKTRMGTADIGATELQMLEATVTTQAVSNIASTTATGNGNITALGIPNTTQHGVVWSTVTNPTIALLTKTEQGAVAATGAFTADITGLSAQTTYYVKAYATNNAGTVYGTQVSFTTSITTEVEKALVAPLKLYPNPATNTITIAGDDKTYTVAIYDLGGSLVLTQQAIGSSLVDITNLQHGVYVVKANGLVMKLVKK